MDKQNSKGSNCRLHPFSILQHGIEVKKDIQNEIFGLIAILKKREHDLCLEVDQQCLELLSEAEELGLCGAKAVYPNHEVDESIQNIKKQDLLPSKLKFTGDLNTCQQTLKNYGKLEKIDSRKNEMRDQKTNNELPGSLIEWVKTVQENLLEKKHISMLENASCCSTKSLEVLSEKKIREENYCHSKLKEVEQRRNILKGVMESVDRRANWDKSVENEDVSLRDSIQGIYELMMDRMQCSLEKKYSPEVVPEAQLNKKRPFCLSSAYQRCNYRMLNASEWLADIEQESPETTTDEFFDMLSEIDVNATSFESYPGISEKKAADDNPQNSIKACFGAYLKQNESKPWLSPNQSSNKMNSTLYEEPRYLCTSPQSSESYACHLTEVAGGDNPQSIIKTCFGSYLKQNESKPWLSPNQSSNKMNSILFEEPRDLWTSPQSSESYACHFTKVAGGDNPQSTIKTCFGSYLKQNDLKQNDLKFWLSPNQSSIKMDLSLCEEWVVKDSAQSFSVEDGIEDPCEFCSQYIIPAHDAQEMDDSFCLIKPTNH